MTTLTPHSGKGGRDLSPIQLKILRALSERDLTPIELRSLYEQKGDGMRNATLVRWGLAEWIRPAENYGPSAIGIKITEAGRAALQVRS